MLQKQQQSKGTQSCEKQKKIKAQASARRKHRNAPAPESLFKVDEDSPRLDAKLAEEHHQATAKALRASQRSRPGTQVATGFHCARVKEPAEQGARKLKQLLAYLREARLLPLAAGEGESGGASARAGGAHAARMGAKGRSGLLAALGRGQWLMCPRNQG